ncbi:MAG: hypothetical protein KGZ70_13360 [Hydrogenophaga sp.]|nr:hypothetical protein [Hydrogenophaga sp.]
MQQRRGVPDPRFALALLECVQRSGICCDVNQHQVRLTGSIKHQHLESGLVREHACTQKPLANHIDHQRFVDLVLFLKGGFNLLLG